MITEQELQEYIKESERINKETIKVQAILEALF